MTEKIEMNQKEFDEIIHNNNKFNTGIISPINGNYIYQTINEKIKYIEDEKKFIFKNINLININLGEKMTKSKSIEFKDCDFNDCNLEDCYTTEINFNKCQFLTNKTNGFVINDINFNKLTFENNKVLCNIYIKNLKEESQNINIDKFNYFDELSLINCTFVEFDIIGDNNSFKKIEICENSNIKSINIGKEAVNEIKINTLNLNKSSYNLLYINNTKFSKVYINRNKNLGKTNFENVRITNLNFINNIFNERIRISWNKENKKGNIINKFKFIRNTLNSDMRIGHTNFSFFEINNLKIKPSNELNIGQSEMKNLEFYGIRNSGSFRIFKLNTNLKKGNLCKISNSNLEGIQLQNINFKSFEKMIMYENLLVNGLITDVTFPLDIQGKTKNNYEQQRNTYRLLKNLMESNNDKVYAKKFFKKEMLAFFAYIFQKPQDSTSVNFIPNFFADFIDLFKNKKKDNFNDFENTLQNRFILFFNKHSNNFGLNWYKPIFWILSLNFIFFLIFLNYNSTWGRFSWNNWFQNIGYFSQFLIPTNTISKIFNSNSINKGWEALNFLFNIMTTILIYQAIVAFRKYSKK